MKKSLPMNKTRSPFLEKPGKLTGQTDFVCHDSFETKTRIIITYNLIVNVIFFLLKLVEL